MPKQSNMMIFFNIKFAEITLLRRLQLDFDGYAKKELTTEFPLQWFYSVLCLCVLLARVIVKVNADLLDLSWGKYLAGENDLIYCCK